MSYSTAQPFDPSQWREVEGFDFTDITYHRAVERIESPDGEASVPPK